MPPRVVEYEHGMKATKWKVGYMMQGWLAEGLRVIRARQGLTLVQAAEKIGVDRHTLRDLELGRRGAYLPTVEKIAEGYGVPVEDLMEEPAFAGKVEAPAKAVSPDEGPENQAEEERREREKYAEALMEQWTEEGEYLEEEIKSSPNGFPLGRAHRFGLGRGLARVLYKEIESTRQPPKALQEAKSRLDEQGELISSLWRQTIHPESGEELDEFKRFATRRAEASLREVDEEGAHSSPRESESSA
jgi:transcriptional regulator with XRE-family HTH domain